jgi:hypothetical protein
LAAPLGYPFWLRCSRDHRRRLFLTSRPSDRPSSLLGGSMATSVSKITNRPLVSRLKDRKPGARDFRKPPAGPRARRPQPPRLSFIDCRAVAALTSVNKRTFSSADDRRDVRTVVRPGLTDKRSSGPTASLAARPSVLDVSSTKVIDRLRPEEPRSFHWSAQCTQPKGVPPARSSRRPPWLWESHQIRERYDDDASTETRPRPCAFASIWSISQNADRL